jgi:hypothetical protein
MVGGNSADKFKLRPSDSLPLEGVTQPGKSAGITIDLTPQSDVAQALGRPAGKQDVLIGASVKDIRAAGFDVVYAPTRENPLHVRIVEGTGKFSNPADRDLLTLAFDRLGKGK